MEDIVRTCYTIRKAFEKNAISESALKYVIEYSQELYRLLSIKTITEFRDNYMTIGIAFAIQTLLIKTEPRRYSTKKYYVINALKCLLNGLQTYENKRWKGECAYWAAVVLFHNEFFLNDCLCDILVSQGKDVSINNITILKNYLTEALVRHTVEVNFKEKSYIPLYNEGNGYNWQKFNELHVEWSSPGSELLREEGWKGADFKLKQEKDSLEKLISTILNDSKYERLKFTC